MIILRWIQVLIAKLETIQFQVRLIIMEELLAAGFGKDFWM